MRVFKSLDFETAKKRIEPNDAGDYLVHLEDYESLNDLIRRSVRTKSKFDLPTQETGDFDDVFSVDEETLPKAPSIDNLFSANEVKEEVKAPQAEQSEGKGAATSDETSEQKIQ